MAITDKAMIIIGVIIGVTLGFGGGFLTKTVMNNVEIANLRAEKNEAELAKKTMQEQWQVAVNELNGIKVTLNDTLAALELLKKYTLVDEKTKQDVKDLKKTLDADGNPTQETEDLFRTLIDKFNQLNQVVTTSSMTYQPIDLEPFVKLKEDADKLYKETQELVFELGLGA